MHILFVTFGELSFGCRDVRPVAILCALADAGHQIDVVASHSTIPDHPHIRFLTGETTQCIPRRKLRKTTILTTGLMSYDVIHAVDDAVVWVSRICKIRKIPLVYDASRCFTSSVGTVPFRFWELFPAHAQRLEKALLRQAVIILTPSKTLSVDLKKISPGASIVQVEDVPLQSFFPKRDIELSKLVGRFEGEPAAIVVVSIFPESGVEMNKLLMAVRKVVDVIPQIAFFFKARLSTEAKAAAANLNILGRCKFFKIDETEEYLAALDIADAALFIPHVGARYVNAELFTLLRSPAPVVAVHDAAYSDLFTENNSVQVLLNPESIAEGLLRVIQEPLLSIGISMEGQQLIADKYSLSSFKHKIRMAYREVLNNE
ncbi:MAG: hypothetical protein V3V05_10135 [Pontiella sp.]